MTGVHKGIGACLRKCRPNLIVLGCPNHLIDLAAKAVSSALPYSIDSLLIDVFYYLEASVNRKLNLKKFQMLIGNEASAGNSETCLYEMAELGPMLAKIYPAMASSSPSFLKEKCQPSRRRLLNRQSRRSLLNRPRLPRIVSRLHLFQRSQPQL